VGAGVAKLLVQKRGSPVLVSRDPVESSGQAIDVAYWVAALKGCNSGCRQLTLRNNGYVTTVTVTSA